MTDERKPGPPTSGECGWYECEVDGMHGTQVLHWRYGEFYVECYERDRHVSSFPVQRPTTALHDYPLRPGDEFRALEAEIVRLRAELASTTQVLRDTTKAHEDLMAECDQDKREAFEAGQRTVICEEGCDLGLLMGFDEWEASRER